MRKEDKRGLSPVIATALLITIAVVLGVIIFLWAKTWVGEKIQKDMGQGAEAIENFCDDVSFDVRVASNGVIEVNNIGGVPLYGAEVTKVGGGSKEKAGSTIFGLGLSVGQGNVSTLSPGGATLAIGDEVVVVPILLGETDSARRTYTCAQEFGKETTVE